MCEYPDEIIELTKALGASTLYEASGIKNSALDYSIRPVWEGAAVAGPAYPVACAPGDNLAIQLALEKAPAGSILVVTTDQFVAGYWGEVLTVAAQAVGIKGLVIDGGVRDIAALRRFRFPVFSRGISVRGTHKDTANSVGQPIQIMGTSVQAGDLVVADDDGVVILPHQCALEIIQQGKTREAKEAVMMRELSEGKTTVELMGLTAWRGEQ
ncbi:MAG: dimethylmenaquinone methyltransferase [Gammaproteobacteria bacterium]|nr:MAG: dimethylmenaquinone methyltransferase [Gammaproteobacteria bacterium]